MKIALKFQAYYGSLEGLPPEEMEQVEKIFASEEVVRKGLLADFMFQVRGFEMQIGNM